MSSSAPWEPKTYRRFVRHHATSTGVAQIVTDAGPAYLKALGNPEGPHALASDWVGTQLARFRAGPEARFCHRLEDGQTKNELYQQMLSTLLD